MKNFLTLQSVETVLGHLRALPVLPAETVPLTEAQGRRLAEALHAPADLPGFDRSTVDGFAVRARDVFGAQEGSPALLECVGDCPMGAVPDISLQPGQCARILTGGMLPEGADCVVMVEYSRPAGGNMVELTRTQAPGDHVVMRDEDAAAGDCIIPAGRKLRPQEIGLLASFGQKDVAVRRAPRVAIISTGDIWGNNSLLGHVGPGSVFAEVYACLPGEPLRISVWPRMLPGNSSWNFTLVFCVWFYR